MRPRLCACPQFQPYVLMWRLFLVCFHSTTSCWSLLKSPYRVNILRFSLNVVIVSDVCLHRCLSLSRFGKKKEEKKEAKAALQQQKSDILSDHELERMKDERERWGAFWRLNGSDFLCFKFADIQTQIVCIFSLLVFSHWEKMCNHLLFSSFLADECSFIILVELIETTSLHLCHSFPLLRLILSILYPSLLHAYHSWALYQCPAFVWFL